MCQQLFNRFVKIAISLFILLSSTQSIALESDKFQTIDIAADNAILDDKAGKAIYRGNVELTQGTLKILAEQLTIEAGAEGKVEKVIAKGEFAEFTQLPNENDKPIEARANTVEYYVAQEKMVLIENARVVQNENLFEGNIIEYDMKRQKLQAHGKALTNTKGEGDSTTGRVKMVLQPQVEPSAEQKPLAKQKPTEQTETETNETQSNPNNE